jgi:hypothetical protein
MRMKRQERNARRIESCPVMEGLLTESEVTIGTISTSGRDGEGINQVYIVFNDVCQII